jgi:prolyl-tRNA editing enzyme YbaK/EbsC (Cys-tRNA(Pro) deacylase)
MAYESEYGAILTVALGLSDEGLAAAVVDGSAALDLRLAKHDFCSSVRELVSQRDARSSTGLPGATLAAAGALAPLAASWGCGPHLTIL